MNTGIIEINLHGMNCYKAKICIDNQLKKANGSVYYIRLIHGYNNGNELKNIGFKYITLDLLGYRTGSMNEVLSEDEKNI